MKQELLAACATAFFPPAIISDAARAALMALVKSQCLGGQFVGRAAALLGQSGYHGDVSDRGKLADMSGERRLRLFSETASALLNNSDNWVNGVGKDVLEEFPAQELISTCSDHEIILWPDAWRSAGGELFAGRMVALKWDQIWFKISAFNLPFPPFQIGSGYDVQDVDRDEAESLSFRIHRHLDVSIKVDLDVPDLARRFVAGLAAFSARYP